MSNTLLTQLAMEFLSLPSVSKKFSSLLEITRSNFTEKFGFTVIEFLIL